MDFKVGDRVRILQIGMSSDKADYSSWFVGEVGVIVLHPSCGGPMPRLNGFQEVSILLDRIGIIKQLFQDSIPSIAPDDSIHFLSVMLEKIEEPNLTIPKTSDIISLTQGVRRIRRAPR